MSRRVARQVHQDEGEHEDAHHDGHQLEQAATWQPTDPVGRFGSSLPAHESVVTAIACFAAAPDNYTEVISSAITLCDDTDTFAAMAGGICGAYAGASAVPPHLLGRLEDGPKGRTYLAALAERLFDQWCRSA